MSFFSCLTRLIQNPNKIQKWVGYRTKRSTENIEAWKEAQKISGKILAITGGIVLIPSVITFIPFCFTNNTTLETASMVISLVQCIAVIFPIIITEKTLKEKFNNDKKK